MATPVITSVEVHYPNGQNYLAPGQTAEVHVGATDTDNRTVTVTVEVADGAGNKISQTVEIVAADPLTFAATSTSEGVTVVQDPTTPSRFYVTLAA